MKSTILLASVVCLAAASGAGAQTQSQQRRDMAMRFQEMDVNNDGVISRREWRGNDPSFRNHDWNNDNVLSGDEVRPEGRRQTRWDDRDIESAVEQETEWTEARFRTLDHNGDG